MSSSHIVNSKWTGVRYFALLAISYAILSFRKKWDSEGDSSSDCEREKTQIMESENVEEILEIKGCPGIQFPWEATAAQYSEQSDGKNNEQSHDETQEKLKFMASMTFASGSLRQPSCPCCI